MFSNLRWILILSIFTSLVSCNLNVGEKPAPILAHQLGKTKCLSNVSPTLSSFVKGHARASDLQEFWTCIDTTIDTFNRYVRGADTGLYSSQEIATFLENNFLEPNSEISSNLQLESMRIKTLFVGGNTSHISRQELDRLKGVLKILRDISFEMNPYMRLFALTWTNKNSKADLDHLSSARGVFLESLKKIAQVIDKNSLGYRFVDFVNLSNEMGKFVGESWSFPNTLQLYLPVIKKVKKTLTGGDEEVIAANEWHQFATLGGRGYSLYLHWYYLVRDNPNENDTTIRYITRVLDEVFAIFADIVAVKKEPSVSQNEIAELLGAIQGIWPQFKVSPELVAQVMKFKVTLIGGKATLITAPEFSLGREKMLLLRDPAEVMHDQLSLFFGRWKIGDLTFAQARDYFGGAKDSFVKSLAQIVGQFEGSYDLQDLLPLLKEVERLYPELKVELTEPIKKNYKLALSIKTMFWGEGSIIRKEQWGSIAESLGDGYSAVLRYQYFVDNKKWNLTSQDKAWLDVLEDGFGAATKIIKQKNRQALSTREIKTLLLELMAQGHLPKVRSRSIDGLLDFALNQVLVTPERRLRGYKPQVLNLESLKVARDELSMFFETQSFLSQWRDDWGNLKARGGGMVYNHFEKEVAKKSNTPELRLALRELTYSVSTVLPLTQDSLNRVTITNKRELFYSLESLRALNIYRALARVLTRAAGTSMSRIQQYQGVNLTEVERNYKKVFPAAVDLGFLEPDNTSFVESRFREANMFMPHSDGNNYVSYVELVDIIAMIWSGINVDGLIKKDIEKSCFSGRKINVNTQIPMQCLVNVYYSKMRTHISSSPEFVNYTNSVSSREWSHYIHNIFKAAGYIPGKNLSARAGDVSLAPHVIQYIELLYARYDKNKNDRIETEEALVAYHAFKSILLKLSARELASGSLQESDLPSLFTYIIKHGKPPETVGEKLSFVMNWRGKPSNWNLQSTRLELAQILGYIADQINK